MNGLDIFLVVTVAAFIVYGAVKGIVRLALGSVAVAVGVLLGCWYSMPLAGALSGWIANESVRRLAAFALIFLATLVAFALLVWIITKTLEAANLRWVDRLSGAALGLAIAALLAAAILVPLTAFLPADSTLVSRSTLSPYVMRISSFVKSVVPAEMKRRYEEGSRRMGQAGRRLVPGAEHAAGTPAPSGVPERNDGARGAGTRPGDPNAKAGPGSRAAPPP